MTTVLCIECTGMLSSPSGAFSPVRLPSVGVLAFVCSHCDFTHLSITSEQPGVHLSLSLTPEQAEALAQELINPRPDPFGDHL